MADFVSEQPDKELEAPGLNADSRGEFLGDRAVIVSNNSLSSGKM